MRKKVFVILVVALIIAMIAILVVNRSRNDEHKIRIGAILPLTGDAGSYGVALKRGMDLALEEINAQGGINGQELVIIFEDSQADPVMAVNSFNKLRSVDRVPMVLGDMFSASTLAISPIAEREGIVLLSPTASAVDLTEAGDYIFRIYPSDTYDGTYLAQYAWNTLEAKRVAIIYIQVASIEAVVQVFTSEFEDAGGDIVATEAYNEGDSDFRSQLAKAIQDNPDIILIPGYLNEMANLLRQAKELGIETPFLSISTFYDPSILELAGNAAEGVMFSSPSFNPESTDPEMQEFAQAFSSMYEQEPDILAGYGYDIVNIAAQALRTAYDPSSPDNIKLALYGIVDYPGVTGETAFDENGDVVKELQMMYVFNGVFTPLQ